MALTKPWKMFVSKPSGFDCIVALAGVVGRVVAGVDVLVAGTESVFCILAASRCCRAAACSSRYEALRNSAGNMAMMVCVRLRRWSGGVRRSKICVRGTSTG